MSGHGQSWDGPRLRRHSDQHDDHCTLTFAGHNWRIVGMQGLGHIELLSIEDGHSRCLLTLADADLEAFANRAAAWLAPDMAIANAEQVQ